MDDTDPDAIQHLEGQIDIQKTLFIVASKSGNTAETLSFFKYFYELLDASSPGKAGSSFVAITDAGTPLVQMGADHNFRKVFINAHIQEYTGEEWPYNEGCLSIPKIREDVYRPETITMEYQDEHFEWHTETFNGISARIIQHEYDHIEGKLFIDYLKPLRKKLLQSKLNDISKGKIKVDYKMIFIK